MTKLTKRVVDAAGVLENDYVIWDDELPGFGLRVFASGKRSYVIQYRANGRSRRYTIGLHGVWTPETARQEAKVQFGRIAGGDNPAEERQLDHKAITVKELCTRYLNDLHAGLILGKGGRLKKPTTIVSDTGRIERHIIPLLGTRRVKDLNKADINKVLKDIMAGKTRVSVKTKKLRGKAIVRGGAGTATRTVGLLGGILTYAGQDEDNAFGSFPNHWRQIFNDSALADVTPHVLRHSFASIANDLGFTEVTIAALMGHAKGSVTSKYIHMIDTALIMAADTISGYIQGLLDGVEFKQTVYALDRSARKAALVRFLARAAGEERQPEHGLAA